jgi:3-hydroxybutyryl-CoA dehydrogenase
MALVAWPDVGECTETLTQFRAITGDDCYRPSQWLRLRR